MHRITDPRLYRAIAAALIGSAPLIIALLIVKFGG